MRTAINAVRRPFLLPAIVLLLVNAAWSQSAAHVDNLDLGRLLDDAEKQARQVHDESTRLRLLDNVALWRARVGQVAQARALIGELTRIEPDSSFDETYIDIARQVARTSDVESAIQAAELASSRRRDEAYYAIAEELVKKGQVGNALSVLNRISRPDNKFRRAQVILGLAGISASDGQAADARLFLDKAAEIIAADLAGTTRLQTGTVELSLGIAAQRRLCGDVAGYETGLSSVQAAISVVNDEERRQQYLYLVAAAAAGAGDSALAEQTLALIAEPLRRAQAMEAIARAQLAAGQLGAAGTTASSIPGLEQRVGVLLLLADKQASSDPAAARKTLQEAAKYLEVASADDRPWGTASLASLEYKLGNRAEAADLWQGAIKLSERFTIHPERYRPQLIRFVAQLQAEAGEEKGALTTASLIGEEALSDVAYAEAKTGKADRALRWIEQQKDPETKANALLAIVMGDVESRTPRQPLYKLSQCK